MSPLRLPLHHSLSTLLAALCLCGSALAGQASPPKALKFTATTSELVFLPPALTQTPPENRCLALGQGTGRTTGAGVAPQLGRFALSASDCILPTSATTFAFSQGQLVLTAANGDTLKATYDGQLNALANPQGLPLYLLDGRLVYNGGTGRFAEATGSGYITGMLNLVTGQGQFNVDSAVSY